MKYWIIGLMIVAIVGASYWAGTRQRDGGDSEAEKTSVEETAVKTATSMPSGLTPTTQVLSVGNEPGDFAPDFRLKDAKENSVSLRDFQNREAVKIVFTVSGQLTLYHDSLPQGVVLLDPDNIVYRLYGGTALPYIVTIDKNGIIR